MEQVEFEFASEAIPQGDYIDAEPPVKKRMLHSVVFCSWLVILYVGAWRNQLESLVDSLSYNSLSLSSFQAWFLDIFGILTDSAVIALAVGMFAYHWRDVRPWQYITFGLFLRYFAFLFLTCLLLYRNSLSQIIHSFVEYMDHRAYVFIGIQTAAALLASFIGMSYGRKTDYATIEDETLGYIAGVSKKVWAALFFSWNPVLQLLVRMSVGLLYKTSGDISSRAYWSKVFSWANLMGPDKDYGLLALVWRLFIAFFIWTCAVTLFMYGVSVITKKKTEFRKLKIIAIYVILPIAIVTIPLIRNREWVY